jgi:5'-deoxynucleotidase YfbR-like HD superfamily hydrolase
MTKPGPSYADIEKLLKVIVLPFQQIKRTIPLPIGDRPWENDAEHSWSVSFLVCALAPEIDEALDVGLICQFAIVHDLVEIYADDTSIFRDDESTIHTKEEREEKALEKITHEFASFPWIAQIISRYERKDTDEALFVYSLDKYIACCYDYLDQGKYFQEIKETQAEYNKHLESHRDKAHKHPAIGKYYDEIRSLLDAHPEFFHPEETNREG